MVRREPVTVHFFLPLSYGPTDLVGSHYRCLSHVVNLANVAVMDCITKIAAVEIMTTIWEYDPSLPDNHVLNGSLNVVTAVRTLAIKVCLFLFQVILPKCNLLV